MDIGGPALVEVVAGINTNAPYGIEEGGDHRHQPFTARDWLLHTSDQNGGSKSKIDEQMTFPQPFRLEAGDWVAVDAWLANQLPEVTGVGPEVILFYSWLP